MEGKRVAIITGSGRGIGKAIAVDLAGNHNRIIIAEKEEYGGQTAAEIRSEQLDAVWIPIDVTDEVSVTSMVGGVVEKYGRIDILVNNAGIRPTTPFLEMSSGAWNKVIDVNLTGAFHCCSAAAPFMVKQKWGRIINITSLAAQQGSTGGHSHYAASKAGIIGLTKSLARELAPYQITVNCIAPGWIDTDGWGDQLEGRRGEFAAKVPIKRLGTPQDVACAASFLASERASYITGVTLSVNGGLYMA